MYPLDLDTSGKGEPEVKALCLNLCQRKMIFYIWILNYQLICTWHGRAQIVGWPPIRSYRKNNLQPKKTEAEASGIYVKVSMDGAPYLRKIDLRVYKGYPELLKALENMFKFTIGKNINISYCCFGCWHVVLLCVKSMAKMTFDFTFSRWVLREGRLQRVRVCTNLWRQRWWLDASWRCSMGVSSLSLSFSLFACVCVRVFGTLINTYEVSYFVAVCSCHPAKGWESWKDQKLEGWGVAFKRPSSHSNPKGREEKRFHCH